jgi:hypothetical protein
MSSDDVYDDDGYDDDYGYDNYGDNDDYGDDDDCSSEYESEDEQDPESTEHHVSDNRNDDGPCDLLSRCHLDDVEEEEEDDHDAGNGRQVHGTGKKASQIVTLECF